jgi:hypothetical protein
MKRILIAVVILVSSFFCFKPSDAGIYDDSDFDGSDLATFAAAYGTATGNPSYNSDCDFANDGDVDTIDLEMVASLVGRTDCEPPEAIKEIGTEGGVVRVYDTESPVYGALVDIPAGAVTSQESCIYISDIDKDQLPVFPDKWQSLGRTIEAGPEGTVFEKTVKLSIPYDDDDHDGIIDGTNIPETSLTVVSADSQSQDCESVEATVDEENNQVIVLANHFSWYDIISHKWASNSTSTYRIDSITTQTDDSADDVKQAIRSAVGVWEQELNQDPALISFQEVGPSESADISFSWISHITPPQQLYTIYYWPNPQ